MAVSISPKWRVDTCSGSGGLSFSGRATRVSDGRSMSGGNARAGLSRWDGARRPTFVELFIALKPLTYFAAAPPRKVTDSACSLPSRRHCLFNRAAALIKVVDTLLLLFLLPRIDCGLLLRFQLISSIFNAYFWVPSYRKV